MYGLLLEAICEIIRTRYGEKTLDEIREKAGIKQSFVASRMYSESLIPRLTKAAHDVTGTSVRELMGTFGESFVPFVDHHGYGRILKVLGRNMRDFLNGLDNLHEYIRFTYPKLKPPSFFCEAETKTGLTLHYRSRRKGFLHYVLGQIRSVGHRYYNTDVDIEILKEEETLDLTHVIMKLHFDNSAFERTATGMEIAENLGDLLLSSDVFFDVFPFHIVFNKGLIVQSAGTGLMAVMPNIRDEAVDELFTLIRPLVEFSLDNILMYSNNVFELTSVDPIQNVAERVSQGEKDHLGEHDDCSLRLKGQMMFMEQWDAVVFLGTPLMENLTRMFETGLYLNDLSMHDSSRDLVLAATQQSSELKMALDQEKVKSQKLEESMRNLDEEMKRTDMLLYQMIPKAVADRLRKGEPAVNTCEVFDHVTILFSDVVGFTKICSQLTPMAVVSMLNGVYTKFDKLSEKHRVYKVETIGDAYMVVSGAPTITKFHAVHISDMALDMLATMPELTEPSTGKSMQIRVGLHSGMVVAGVVGLKMPRYCLFGDTVNMASKMENNGEAMKVHISETTKVHLDGQGYHLEERGTITVAGAGQIRTYWLSSKKDAKKPSITSNGAPQTTVEKSDLPIITETDTARDAKNDNILYTPIMDATRDVIDQKAHQDGRKSKMQQNDNNSPSNGTSRETNGDTVKHGVDDADETESKSL